MDLNQDNYTITQLSEILKLTDHTLRYYEKELHLDVPKDGRGHRYYTPEVANIFWQIKKMRDEGLEIKAIRKILISKNIIPDTESCNLAPVPVMQTETLRSTQNMETMLSQFRQQLLSSIAQEISCAKDDLADEIYRSKLELGACVENNFRKLEAKMERHFHKVDQQLTNWRDRNKKKKLTKLFII